MSTQEYTYSSTYGGGGGGMNSRTALDFGSAIADFFAGLLAFVWGVGAAIASLFSALPWLIFAIVLTLLMIPWVTYHDEIIEEVEHAFRGVLYPAWRDVGVPIANFVRSIWNPLICWFDAANWWAYGLVQEVLYPTVVECSNLRAMFTALGEFLLAVLKDFVVDYFFASGFYNGPCDFTNICNKWIAFWNEWMMLWSCMCFDLARVFQDLPIFFSPLFSAQWADPQLWCAVSNLVNAAMEAFAILLRLVMQLLQALLALIAPQSQFAAINFQRPNFYNVFNLTCAGAKCFTRSTENAFQRFWDDFIPFHFNFTDFFSPIDVMFCLTVKTINWFLTVIINIDRVVLFPSNDFWEKTMKPLTVENINIVAAPSQFAPVPIPPSPYPLHFTVTNYYLNTSYPFTTLNALNPVYGQKRLTEAVCVVLTRIICDATGGAVPCFSGQTGNVFQGFDFCCATNSVGTLVVDTVSAVVELSYHLVAQSGQDFFLFIDGQPFLAALVQDLVSIVRCLLSFLRLIPVVGRALENLLVEAANWLLSMVRFIIQTVLGLATLPFFIFELQGTPNFITTTNEALNEFVAIQQRMVAAIPESFVNSLCIVLNSGFPIPPIPCTSCNVGGFIPLPPAKKRLRTFVEPDGRVNSPWNLAAEAFGWQNPDSAYLVTPLLYYDTSSPRGGAAGGQGGSSNSSSAPGFAGGSRGGIRGLFTRMNPTEAIERIMKNAQTIPNFSTHEEVDRFVDMKKQQMLERWTRVVTCADLKREEAELRETRPHVYRYNKQNGKYDCDEQKEREEIRKAMGTPSASGGGGSQNGGVVPPASGRGDSVPTPAEAAFGPPAGGAEHHSHADRLTLGPTIPPLSTCTNPTPDCFDLCCLFRTTVQLGAHLLSFIARFFNGFVQYEASRQGTTRDFPYFTGEFCEPQFNQPCFESDLVEGLLLAFQLPSCLCRFLNLVIPISLSNPRPDICCAIQRFAELVVCLLMVIINSINSLILGQYDYFRAGLFFNDVSMLFDIALEFSVCMCNLARAIFPIDYIPELKNALSFDICCIPMALFEAAVELLRLFVLTVISLATITVTPSSYCFFRLDNDGSHACAGTLDGIGIVQRADVFINRFLPVSDVNVVPQTLSCSLTCSGAGATAGSADQGIGSIVPCFCQLFNTLIPWRAHPDQKVSCDATAPNCQNINLCCPLVKLGIAMNEGSKFVVRALVALWQPWNGLPEFFVHFVFCDETASDVIANCGTANSGNPCAYNFNGVPKPACNCGTFTCGKTNVVIDNLTALVSACLCELVRFLDALILMFFESLGTTWANCFCGAHGILQSAAKMINIVLKQSINSIRKSPLPCFWNPAGFTQLYSGMPLLPVPPGTCTPGVDPACECHWIKAPVSSVQDSWIYSVLGPVANAACQSIGDFMCIINSLFFVNPVCLKSGSLLLGGTVRWGFEFIFRVATFIEGFIRQFTDPQSTCIGADHTCSMHVSSYVFQGIQSKPLAKILVALLSFPVDMLIGDRTVACSGICPRGISDNFFSLCDCWKLSPATAATYDCGGGQKCSVWDFGFDMTPPGGCDTYTQLPFPGAGCKVVATPQFGNVGGILGITGLNCVTGVGAVLPYCSNIDDVLHDIYVFYVNIGICTGLDMSSCFVRAGVNPNTITSTCSKYNLCRPDNLPSCGGSAITDLEHATIYSGPIDGLIMGLFRYINCAIPGNVLYPLLWFLSFVWQLMGAVIYFVVTLIFFVISLFTTSGGCGCWDGPDDAQCGNIRKHTRTALLCYPCFDTHGMCGFAATEGLNYVFYCEDNCPFRFGNDPSNGTLVAQAQQQCVDAMNQCWSPVVASDAPFSQYCDGTLTNYFVNRDCVSGLFAALFQGNFQACRDYVVARTALSAKGQATCPAPYCQVGGSGIIYNAGQKRGDKTGSSYPGGPLVDCFLKNLFDGFSAVIQAFVAIFTTPIMSTAAYKRDALEKWRMTDFKESRLNFWKRAGINRHLWDQPADKNKKRTMPEDRTLGDLLREAVGRGMDGTSLDSMLRAPDDVLPKHVRRVLMHAKEMHARGKMPNESPEFQDLVEEAERYTPVTESGFLHNQPSTPELLLMSLYEYDTSDCFSDPVSCVCRNFYIPEYCTWTPQTGVIPTPTRKRDFHGIENRTRFPRADVMYPEEVMAILTERFNDSHVCDHNIQRCAQAPFTDLSKNTMEKWVECVDRRIQGERLSDASGGVITPDVMYNTHAPLTIFQNLIARTKADAERKRDERRRFTTAERNQTLKDFPDLWKQLDERALMGRHSLVHDHGIPADSPIIEGIIQMDHMWYKYQTGYYKSIFLRAWESMGGFHWPSSDEAFLDLHEATTQLLSIVRGAHYRQGVNEAMKQARVAYDWFSDVFFEQGLVEYARSHVEAYRKRRRDYIEETKPQREALWEAWSKMPLVKYFKGEYSSTQAPPNDRYTIFDHLSTVADFRRREAAAKDASSSTGEGLWAVDLRLRDAWNHMTTPRWTPEKEENWRAIGRMVYRAYDTVYPGALDSNALFEGVNKRVFINGNCRLVDRTLNLTLKLVDYCANEFMPNVNFKRDSFLVDYLQSTSHKRHGTFFSSDNIKNYALEPTVPHDQGSWIRPRWNGSTYWETHTKNTRRFAGVDRHTYKRAIHIASGPAQFNFYAWFVSVVESILGYMFNANTSSWWSDAKAWLQNPNTEESDWPDVGLRYWLLFFIRCPWPDCLNCSKGIGLKWALLWVSLGVLGAVLVGAFILPPIAWVFTFIPAWIVWIVLIGVIGFHYSPRCFFLTPALTGISVTLPMCLADELKDLFDTIFRSCYSPVPIPDYMIAGDICPVDPNARIDFINCAIIGVSDGIQNILFLGTVLIGQWFYDIALQIAQTTIAMIIPGTDAYMRATLDSFRFANPTQRQRQWVCFGITAPSMVLILAGFSIVFIALGLIIPLLIMLIMKLWYLVVDSPAGSVLPGGDDTQWDETYPDTDPRRKIEGEEDDEGPKTLEEVREWIRDRKDK